MVKWQTKDTQIGIRITTKNRTALERIARRERIALSALVRRVMEEYVERDKKRRRKG